MLSDLLLGGLGIRRQGSWGLQGLAVSGLHEFEANGLEM